MGTAVPMYGANCSRSSAGQNCTNNVAEREEGIVALHWVIDPLLQISFFSSAPAMDKHCFKVKCQLAALQHHSVFPQRMMQ